MAVSARLREYWATKERAIRLKTVEIYHPAVGVKRLVLNQFQDKTLTLEADAPRNPSTAVVFTAVGGDIPDAQRTSEIVNTSLQFGRIGQAVKSYLNDITGTDKRIPIEVIYRTYLATDTSAPVSTPEYYTAVGFSIDGITASAQLTDVNPRRFRVASLFDEDKFTGLKGNI